MGKEARPELATDLKAMGLALKEEWDKVPEDKKEEMQKEYEKAMEIWRPKWAAYKETEHYKVFFEIKQDWVDGRQKKKLVKKFAKDAPKRPRSGYMIHAGEIREQVQKEVFEAGGGMGDIGKKIAEYWAAVSEAKRADYAEQSARMKATFDIEYAAYKKTDSFKEFMESKAKLEGKQTLKKLQRTKLDEAPKKAPSAFALFRSKVTPTLMEAEENKKLERGELGKKIAGMWAEVPEDEKKKYEEESVRLKEEYAEKLKGFKQTMKYTDFLQMRHKCKDRENRLVNLRELPKRPRSTFSLFAEDHKKEVEPGKGEGRGISALKQKWAEASKEEKDEYEEKEKKLKEQWVADVGE